MLKIWALYRSFYWTGVVLAVVSLSLALARNSTLLDSWRGPGIPWSWVAGVVAIFAFVCAEGCDPGGDTSGERGPAGEPTPNAESDPSREAVYQEM